MHLELNGRKVVDIIVDGIDFKDYPDFSDAYFDSAMFDDTGEYLSINELEVLAETYPDKLYEMAIEC